MSNILSKIENEIINQLNQIPGLLAKISGIYTHVPANSKFPYICLGKFQLTDKSTKTTKFFELNFVITIYSKDRNNLTLYQLTELVSSNMEHIYDLKNYTIEIDQKPDSQTSFANLKYKIFIG